MLRHGLAAIILLASLALTARQLAADTGDGGAFLRDNLLPGVQAAEGRWETSCRCQLAIQVEASIDTLDEMHGALSLVESIGDGVVATCRDDARRAAMCRMSTLSLRGSATPAFHRSGASGVALIAGDRAPSYAQIAAALTR